MKLIQITVRITLEQVAELLKDALPPGYQVVHEKTGASCARWYEPGEKTQTSGFDITLQLTPEEKT